MTFPCLLVSGLYIVKLVDENLDKLAQMLCEEEKESIDVLATIGEIRGLLLDLLM